MAWTDSVRGSPIIVAAGGGLGEPVHHWRKVWPRALFALFEPGPASFKELERSFCSDPRVVLSSRALSDREGPATLYLSRTPMASSLLPFNTACADYYPEWATVEAIPVQTVTLDGWAQEQGIDHIGFVELDLQGGELAALRGAEGLLRARAIDALMVEVFHTELYQGCPMAEEVRAYMAGLSYRAVEEKSQEGSRFADILFVGGLHD